MQFFSIFILFLNFQENVPFKPSDEFTVRVGFTYKNKSLGEGASTFSSKGDRVNKSSPQILPFLLVDISEIKIQKDEVRVIAVDSQGPTRLNRKTSSVKTLHFEMGFVEDIVTKSVPSEVMVYFVSTSKRKLRRIDFTVTSTGIFVVNGAWHGQL